MTRQELIKEVNARLSLIENSHISISDELSFLRMFTSTNSVNDIESISQIDECEIFLAYLLVTTEVPYEKLKEKIDLIRPMVQDPNMTKKTLRNVFSGIIANWDFEGKTENALKETTIVKIKKSINDRKVLKVLKSNNIPKEYLNSANAFTELVLLLNEDIIRDYSFEDEVTDELSVQLEERLNIFTDAFVLMGSIKGAKETCDGKNTAIALVDENDNVITITDESITKKDKKYINRQVSKLQEYKEIISKFNIIVNYYNKLENNLGKIIKKRNKKAQAYKNFLTSMQTLATSDEITNYYKALEFIPDEDLKLYFLQYVYNNNLKFTSQLEEEYRRTFTKEKASYNKVLSEYSLPNNDEFLNSIISRYTVDELKETLECFKKINFNDKELICKALSISSKETITFLSSLTEKQIIPVTFYRKNLSVFSNESSKHHTVLENINSITSSGINPRYLYENTDILLVDNDTLQERIDLMKDEELLSSIKKDSDISFFKTPDLASKISIIKRTSHLPSVVDNIDLLNASSTRWKRVLVMETIDMPINSSDLAGFLEKDDFFIPDNKLNDYIPNTTSSTTKNLTAYE